MGGSKGVMNAELKRFLTDNLGVLAGVHGSIVSAAENTRVRTILVTSCNRGEGKTMTASSMAYGLASQANADVLLVDCNFFNPAIHEYFGVPRQPGLSDFLTTEIGLEDVVCPTEDPRLMILPNGGAKSSLYDIVRSASFAQRFASLKDKFDYVICDGGPLFGASESSSVGSLFDGIVLVVECERTRWEVVQDAKERLAKAGGKILGVVLNKRNYYIPRAFYGVR
jgi:protein-tyrosine kinase